MNSFVYFGLFVACFVGISSGSDEIADSLLADIINSDAIQAHIHDVLHNETAVAILIKDGAEVFAPMLNITEEEYTVILEAFNIVSPIYNAQKLTAVNTYAFAVLGWPTLFHEALPINDAIYNHYYSGIEDGQVGLSYLRLVAELVGGEEAVFAFNHLMKCVHKAAYVL